MARLAGPVSWLVLAGGVAYGCGNTFEAPSSDSGSESAGGEWATGGQPPLDPAAPSSAGDGQGHAGGLGSGDGGGGQAGESAEQPGGSGGGIAEGAGGEGGMHQGAVVGIDVSPTRGLYVRPHAPAMFRIVLASKPDGDVVIELIASAKDRVELDKSRLTFDPEDWHVPQVVMLEAVLNDIAEGDQAVKVVTQPAQSSDLRYHGLDAADVDVLVLDDADPCILLHTEGPLSTSETGRSDTFRVTLCSKPLAAITIPLASSDPSEAAVLPSVTIEPSDWSRPHIVTVTGVDDSDLDGNQPFSIVTGLALSDDLGYHGMNTADPAGLNGDDD